MISENIKINEHEKARAEQVYAGSIYIGKIPLDVFINTQCQYCKNKCIHANAFRRMPCEVGGLGLCENLK